MNETEIIKNIITLMVEEGDIDKNFTELRYLFRRYEEAEVREECKLIEKNQ